ncbi:MAG TPA: DNA polymerase subunit beta [Bacteroidales bacterium]|nr:DNA polymerase subunit beta [Bacteroidales bacterium]
MKSTEQCIDIIRSNAALLKSKYGITSLSLFGSVARGEQNDDSDVDVFVSMPAVMRNVLGANMFLEQILGCDVDMVRNHSHLSANLLTQINRDAINVF